MVKDYRPIKVDDEDSEKKTKFVRTNFGEGVISFSHVKIIKNLYF
jgi:hypothetical protein